MTRRPLIAAAALAASLALAPAAQASLIEELWPDGPPFPFAALLDDLRGRGATLETALIPIGRSLQRFAADPDYAASPRVVVAVGADAAAGPASPRLADRLFLGYQPAARMIEAISWDEAAGAFRFFEVYGYAPGETPVILAAEPRVCGRCHQHGGPIFSRSPWAETNASPAVATMLAPLGESWNGAPARLTVDDAERFDDATDRAATALAAQRIWREGCPDPSCRAALLASAIGVALAGPAHPARAPGLEASAAALWPDGLRQASPDIPATDPAIRGMAAPDVDPPGALNPEATRPPERVWPLRGDAVGEAAAMTAALLTRGDLARLDAALARRPAEARAWSLPCRSQAVGRELRFRCEDAAGRAAGFLALDPPGRGRIEGLVLDGASAPAILRVDGGAGALGVDAARAPRLSDGRRIEALALSPDGAALSGRAVDDLAPLAQALRRAGEAGDPALDGPFRRRAALALVDAILAEAPGLAEEAPGDD